MRIKKMNATSEKILPQCGICILPPFKINIDDYVSHYVRNVTNDDEMQADQPEYDTDDDAEEDATEDEIDADEAAMFEEA